MTTKNLVLLASAAAVLGGAAYLVSSDRKMKTPSLAGRKILPAFSAADVSRIETVSGDKKLALAAGENGWTVESMFGYPADVEKIRENLLKLVDLKVGQVARGRTFSGTTDVSVKDAAGKTLASLKMGDTHTSKPRGQMAQFGGGGYPDGRYVLFGDTPVLVKETLDAFDGDPKRWVDSRIASVPSSDVVAVEYSKGKEKVSLKRADSKWTLEGLDAEKEELDSSKTYSLDSGLSYLDFASVADPSKPEAEFGFATGSVYTVTMKDGTRYTAEIGGFSGSDRYFRVKAAFTPSGTNETVNAECRKKVDEFNAKSGKWVYAVSSYSADSMSKTRADLVKAKEPPKKDDASATSKPVEIKTGGKDKAEEKKEG